MAEKRNIIITGGAGFIGSHVVRLFVNKYPNYRIINVDVWDFNDEVRETWKYKGRNRSIDEFTMKFVNGELVSVDQYKESYY